jgi:ADP-ribosylglycohydrolase
VFKGIIIGDAYGAGFEFKRSMLVHNDGQKYYDHPTHMASDGLGNALKAGQYTDDCQMSIAVAETLLKDDWSSLAFANKFTEVFHRDPRKGYAKGFYNFLLNHHNGESFIRDIKPDSEKNGAAMRSVPLGYLPIDKIMDVAECQAKLTHDTLGGIHSSQIVALAAHYLLRNTSKDNLVEFVESYVPGYKLDEEWKGEVQCHGIQTAKAALSVVLRTDSWHETIIKSVGFGGDTDSTSSISLGLQLCYTKSIEDINSTLIVDVENTNYGLDYVTDLDNQLKGKFLCKD